VDYASIFDGCERVYRFADSGFDHDFHRFVENCEQDRRVIHALGQALEGSDRPLIITSGTGMGNDGPTALSREDQFKPDNHNPRVASEVAGDALLAQGVDVRVVRLPQVHDTARQGLITHYIQHAAETGAVACIGEGNNCWSAAHVNDVARLYVQVLEQGERGRRYHAVAEEGVATRKIAQVVADKLGLPQISLSAAEADAHFGWFVLFAAMDLRASSDWAPPATLLAPHWPRPAGGFAKHGLRTAVSVSLVPFHGSTIGEPDTGLAEGTLYLRRLPATVLLFFHVQ